MDLTNASDDLLVDTHALLIQMQDDLASLEADPPKN